MSITGRQFKNILVYSAPRFFSYGLNLLILPILTRLLTPHEFGVVALAWLFPTFAVSLFTLGIQSGAERYYFEHRHDSMLLSRLYGTTQLFFGCSFIVSVGVVYLFSDVISKYIIGSTEYGIAILLAYAGNFIGTVNTFYLRIYQSMERAVLHAGFMIFQSVCTAIFGLVLVWYFKMSYMGMIVGSAAGTALTFIGLFLHFNKGAVFRVSKKSLVENIRYGIQIVPKSFTGFINRSFDKYLLNNMLSLSAVGVFNIGQTVSNSLFFLMNSVWSSIQPVCYKEVFDKGDGASVSTGKLFTLFSYLCLCPAIVLILFAEELVFLVAPAPYYGAIDIIILSGAGMVTQTFGMFSGVQFAYSKRPIWITPIAIGSTVVNVIANLLLVPRIGAMGAALASVLSLFAGNMLCLWIGQRLYRIAYEKIYLLEQYSIIIVSVMALLAFRAFSVPLFLLYSFKFVMVTTFLFSGFHAGVLTVGHVTGVYNKICGVISRR